MVKTGTPNTMAMLGCPLPILCRWTLYSPCSLPPGTSATSPSSSAQVHSCSWTSRDPLDGWARLGLCSLLKCLNALPTRTAQELYRCGDYNFRVTVLVSSSLLTKGNSGAPFLEDMSKESEVLAKASWTLMLLWWWHQTPLQPRWNADSRHVKGRQKQGASVLLRGTTSENRGNSLTSKYFPRSRVEDLLYLGKFRN